MLKNFFQKIETKLGIDLNENFLTLFLSIIAILFVVAAVFFGDAQWTNILGMGAGIFMNCAIFLGVVFVLEIFMMGLGYNIIDEIKAGNIALAISLASLRIGLAMVIAKGFM